MENFPKDLDKVLALKKKTILRKQEGGKKVVEARAKKKYNSNGGLPPESPSLQVNPRGFFAKKEENMIGHLTTDDLNAFDSLSSDGERVKFVWNRVSINELNIMVNKGLKNCAQARNKRARGLEYLAKREVHNALNCFNEAIMLAPLDRNDETMGLCLGDRAECMLLLGEVKMCLSDIKEALRCGYPYERRYLMLEKRGDALLLLDQIKEAAYAFMEARAALCDAKLGLFRKKQTQQQIREKAHKCQRLLAVNTCPKVPAEASPVRSEDLPSLSHGRNPRFGSASSTVTVNQNDSWGRFAAATKPINIGDTLVVEKAFVSCLLSQKYKTHCLHCLKRFRTALPCYWCSNVAFCSSSCRQKACDTYHKWECSILNYLADSGTSIICHMSLRVITARGLDYFKEKAPLLTEVKKELEAGVVLNEEGKYDDRDYLSMYHLAGHCDKRQRDDYLHRTIMAVFLLRCLMGMGFFMYHEPKDLPVSVVAEERRNLTEWELLIGRLLLRHLQVIQFNAHEVYEYCMESEKKLNNIWSSFIGAALYPTVSFFNHSCDPGVIRYFVGDTIVIRSLRNYQEGDMISENYGPQSLKTSLVERQDSLMAKYWFLCQCEACNGNWPTLETMKATDFKIRCEFCFKEIKLLSATNIELTVCQNCGGKMSLVDVLKTLRQTEFVYQRAEKFMAEGEADHALRLLFKLLSLLDKILCRPNRNISLCEEAIRACLMGLGSTHVIKS